MKAGGCKKEFTVSPASPKNPPHPDTSMPLEKHDSEWQASWSIDIWQKTSSTHNILSKIYMLGRLGASVWMQSEVTGTTSQRSAGTQPSTFSNAWRSTETTTRCMHVSMLFADARGSTEDHPSLRQVLVRQVSRHRLRNFPSHVMQITGLHDGRC